MNFILARTFTDSLAKLDTPLQSQVKAAVFDFQQNPKQPGFQFHRIDRAKDKHMWSARVNDDLRMVIHHAEDRAVFCFVGHHDDAYAWGERRRLEQNPVTGAAQFVEIKERVEEITKTIVKEVVREAPLFARFERDYLLALGVPTEWLDAVGTVDTAGLEKLESHLPAEAYERLFQLACGEPVPRPVAAPTADPYAHPDARRRFVVLDDRVEFRRALEHPWEQWLVFLHPTQRAVAQRHFNGPARVTGTAGTGKSVVAIHRVAELAKTAAPGSVLLTTFSRTLASRLAQNLALLMPDDGATSRVAVQHLHKLAWNLWTASSGRVFNQLKSADLPLMFGDALRRASPKVALTVPFLRSEWESVVDPWGIRTWEAYRSAPRAGRSTPMGLKQRMEVWKVFDALHGILRERRVMSWSQLCYEAAQGVGSKPPFRHVVADECQDFGPAEFTLLRSIAPLGSDDLFLCGDAGQRIYRAKFTYGGLGIDVRGRSTRLKVNYRTTEQIRRFADGLIPATIDEGDGDDGVRATVSVLSGPVPESRSCASVAEEIEAVASWVKGLLAEGFLPRDVAVFARTEALLRERAQKALEAAGVDVHALDDETPLSATQASVGTMHRAKGLEFRAVAVVGCDQGALPSPKALEVADDADRDAAIEQERQLLYVATTRARERLLVTSSGVPSEFLATRTGASRRGA